jgi:hypothetical protein
MKEDIDMENDDEEEGLSYCCETCDKEIYIGDYYYEISDGFYICKECLNKQYRHIAH